MGIPKRIGALKLPKKVRKQAKRAIKQAASPLVRDFASAAMAAANRVRREAEGDRKREDDSMGETRIHIDGNKLGEAIRKAAADGLRTFLEGLEEGLRDARKDMDDPQPDPRAKPPKPPKPPKAAKAAKPPKPPKPPKAAKPPKPRASRPGSAKPAPRAPGA